MTFRKTLSTRKKYVNKIKYTTHPSTSSYRYSHIKHAFFFVGTVIMRKYEILMDNNIVTNFIILNTVVHHAHYFPYTSTRVLQYLFLLMQRMRKYDFEGACKYEGVFKQEEVFKHLKVCRIAI